MKKIIFIFLISIASISVCAQLKNTKWKGTIHSDNDIDVIFNYGSDTLEVTSAADGSSFETCIYNTKDTVLSVQKIYGQSNCDTTGIGKYKFEIKDDILYLTLLSDNCDNRSSALNNSKWAKME